MLYHITENLRHALRYLRNKEKSENSWVDAVCIKQNDEDENLKQVRKMGEIYSVAARVYAWLGRADCQIGGVLSFCKSSRIGKEKGKFQPISTLLNNFLSVGSYFAMCMRPKPVLYPDRSIWTMTCCTKNLTGFVPYMCGLTGAVLGLSYELIMANAVVVCYELNLLILTTFMDLASIRAPPSKDSTPRLIKC
jgi:hypothetical protein